MEIYKVNTNMSVLVKHPLKVPAESLRGAGGNFVNNKLEQQPMIEALDQPIAREEVVVAVKSLQNLKAPGEDGLPSEL